MDGTLLNTAVYGLLKISRGKFGCFATLVLESILVAVTVALLIL